MFHTVDYFEDIIGWIELNKPNKHQLSRYKIELCTKYKTKNIPTDISILMHASSLQVDKIRPFLQTKPVRTGSGVAVVAVMTKPFACPHGSCTYCPGGPGSVFGDTPKSYTGKEPSTMRGARHDYDPYRIIFNRLEQYIVMGQNPDKVEQIIMGGTFCALPKDYREDFVHFSFKAFNDFSDLFYKDGEFLLDVFKEFFELPGPVGDPVRAENIRQRVVACKNRNCRGLAFEHKRNEQAAIRCIGLTIETKPDWGFLEHGLEALRLGATRIELGIQTLDDRILTKVHRGHDLGDSKRSIQELRDLGFKLNFHMMPGLPGPDGRRVSEEHDISELGELFSNADYRPDMLKIYPCMVMPGTALFKAFEKGEFVPLTTQQAARIITEGLRSVPEYCRIMRVQRDIPTHATSAGVDKTNLRQYVDVLSAQLGVKSRDIRARELGLHAREGSVSFRCLEYEASGGREFFIQAIQGDDQLLGFVRLRFPGACLHEVITPSSALVRELHVYGSAIRIGGASGDKAQHTGVGKQLMALAQGVCVDHGKDKILVISGVGVRAYYKKIGYVQEGPYMVKLL